MILDKNENKFETSLFSDFVRGRDMFSYFPFLANSIMIFYFNKLI